MAQQVKRISSQLNIFAAVTGDPTTVVFGQPVPNNAQVTINGNLSVRGTTTTINSEELSVADNFITLNSDVLPVTVPSEDAGIVVNRGAEANVSIRWNETVDQWQMTKDGSTFSNIASVVNGSYLSAVVEDLDPHLGGNLVTNGWAVTSTSSITIAPTTDLLVSSPLRLTEVTTPPALIAGESIIYAAPSTGGGTGVYVASGVAANEELVSKKKAIVFSLLF